MDDNGNVQIAPIGNRAQFNYNWEQAFRKKESLCLTCIDETCTREKDKINVVACSGFKNNGEKLTNKQSLEQAKLLICKCCHVCEFELCATFQFRKEIMKNE